MGDATIFYAKYSYKRCLLIKIKLRHLAETSDAACRLMEATRGRGSHYHVRRQNAGKVDLISDAALMLISAKSLRLC